MGSAIVDGNGCRVVIIQKLCASGNGLFLMDAMFILMELLHGAALF